MKYIKLIYDKIFLFFSSFFFFFFILNLSKIPDDILFLISFIFSSESFASELPKFGNLEL